MRAASEIEPVARGLWIWRAYDPAIKAELFSTAIATSAGIYLIDPIPLAPNAVAALRGLGKVAGIGVTNENHQRAADHFAKELQLVIYERALEQDGLIAIAIDGAPRGEIAIFSQTDGGTMVIGDALINFDPHGFCLLPAKYCLNRKTMRRSLGKLLHYAFDRMLFAHGMPILSGARGRLEELLREG